MPQVNEHPEILLYTRIKSPYYYASRRHGVQMYSVYNHTYHPRHYGDPVAEYWHLLNGVTLWDVGVERQIEISGPGLRLHQPARRPRSEQVRRGAVQVRLCACRTAGSSTTRCSCAWRRTASCSLADSDVELWARGVAHNSDFDVTIKEIDLGPVQVQGPKSKDVMVDLFGEHPRDPLLPPPLRARRDERARLAPVTRASSATRSTCTRPAARARSCGMPCSRRASRTTWR